MPVTIITELGVQHPLFGYQRSDCPEGGYTHALNVGLIGFVLYPASVPAMLERWHRVIRKQAWEAVTGGTADGEAPQ
jgi:hypothetical protein